ncbi:MAG: heavy metal translocating P-type ATPase [Candidatus Competibacterales bacterium]
MILTSLVVLGVGYTGLRLAERLGLVKSKVSSPARTLEVQFPSTTASAPPAVGPVDHHHEYLGAASLALALASLAAPGLRLVTGLLIAYTTLPILRRTEERLVKEKRVGNDLLSSLITIVCLSLGQLIPAAIQNGMYHFAQGMADRSKRRARRVLLEAMPPPKTVWVIRGGSALETPLAQVAVGDHIAATTGDLLAIDGRVAAGAIAVDQQAITGEALPVWREAGEPVYAGALVVAGQGDIEVTQTGANTAAAQLAQLLARSTDYVSQTQLRAEGWSDAMAVPAVVGSAVLWPVLGVSAASGLLFSAPTCAVRAMGARVTSRHLSRFVQRGIIVKDGRALEGLGQVDTVLFDKTGTLTDGVLQVCRVVAATEGGSPWGEARLLGYAAAAEGTLDHPIGQAITRAAQERALGPLPAVQSTAYHPGYGVTAWIEDHTVHVGSHRFVQACDIELAPSLLPFVEAAEARGRMAVFICVGRQTVGLIELEPRLRPEARGVVEGLQALGITDIQIVSGDREQPTRAMAEALGIGICHCEVLPAHKAELVGALQAQGRTVCFVGDGINDALAIQRAQVSISLQGAAALATDTAQVVLLDGTLRQLPELIVGARALRRHLYQTLGLWGGFGVTNVALSLGLRAGLLASSNLFWLFYLAGWWHSQRLIPLESPGSQATSQSPGTAPLQR